MLTRCDHETSCGNRITCGMNLVSKIVEIQIPFNLEECLFPQLLTDVNCLKFIDLKTLSNLLPVILLGREQMTHKLRLKKALCKDFLPPDLLKVNFKQRALIFANWLTLNGSMDRAMSDQTQMQTLPSFENKDHSFQTFHLKPVKNNIRLLTDLLVFPGHLTSCSGTSYDLSLVCFVNVLLAPSSLELLSMYSKWSQQKWPYNLSGDVP